MTKPTTKPQIDNIPSETPLLKIAVTSSALFDLNESHKVFTEQGISAYRDYQRSNEGRPFDGGVALSLVRKLSRINELIKDRGGAIETILLSRNTSDTGLRSIHSLEHHDLDIKSMAFCGGESPHRYALAFGVHLFLSTEADDVAMALREGIASATLMPDYTDGEEDLQLRFAFDGDAVLFSDEAQKVYDGKGLEAFEHHEREKAETPMPAGPFRPFVKKLHQLQSLWSDSSDSPIRTALITARSGRVAHRVIKTLRSWGIQIDETIFAAGVSKKPLIEAFKADIFLDDFMENCHEASAVTVSGHVPRVE